MNLLILALAAAIVFYIVLPFIGALLARRKWRTFRGRLINSSFHPVYAAGPDSGRTGSERIYRFFGQLEAIEDMDIIWLSDGTHRVRADLSKVPVFILPGRIGQDSDPSAENSPAITRWKRLGSLPEGTEFFIYGQLSSESLVPIFRSVSRMPLLVIIHDTDRELFLSRAIRTGRQRNEYWNSISPFSFLSGVMLELLLILTLLQNSSGSLLLFVLVPLALLPGLILAPPGIFLYFLYRNYWRLGRKYREERDLLRLPLRYPDNNLPDGGKYISQALEGFPEEFIHDGDIRIRHVMAASDHTGHIWSYHAYQSSDPFAEHIYIRGNPELLAAESQHKAVFLEYLSLGFFFAGLAVNILMVELLLLMFWF